MTPAARAAAHLAGLDGDGPWGGPDVVIHAAPDAPSAARRDDHLRRLLSRTGARVIGVVEGSRRGNLRGIARAWRAALDLDPSLSTQLRAGARLTLLLDAGAASRTGLIARAEGAGRGDVRLPGALRRDAGGEDALTTTLLSLVTTHLPGLDAPGGALEVVWVSQLVVPGGRGDALPDALIVKRLAPAPDPSADLGQLAADADGRVTGFRAAGSPEPMPEGAVCGPDLGGGRLHPDLLDALLRWEAALPEGLSFDLDPHLVAALAGAVTPAPEIAALMASLPGDRTLLGAAHVGGPLLWRRARRPAELLGLVRGILAGDPDHGALRAALGVRHPVVGARLGDVFVTGPELTFAEVEAGVTVGGVTVRDAAVQRAALEAGSRLEGSVILDSAGMVGARGSYLLGAAAEELVADESIVADLHRERPLIADRVVLVGLGEADHHAPLEGDPGPVPPGVGEPPIRPLDPTLPPEHLRAALDGLATEGDWASLGAAACFLVEDVARLASRRLFSRLMALGDARTPAAMAEGLGITAAACAGRTRLVRRDPATTLREARARRAATAGDRRPQRVAVLSRVTIGADVAVTSVVLARLRQALLDAEITVLGPPSVSALFAELPGVRTFHAPWSRASTLGERLRVAEALATALREIDPELLISPDSRLDQHGVLDLWPDTVVLDLTVPEDNHRRLDEITNAACDRQLFPGEWVTPSLTIAAAPAADPRRVLVRFGVGGDAAKRASPAQEAGWIAELRAAGRAVVLDVGIGPEVADADALLAEAAPGGAPSFDPSVPGTPGGIERFQGDLPALLRAIAGCAEVFGYDSAGGHLARALGREATVIFQPEVSPRFRSAWTPPGARWVLDPRDADPLKHAFERR